MPPLLLKILPYVIAAVTSVSLLGPVVAQWSGLVPASWLLDASRVVAFAGTVHLWLSASPLSAWSASRRAAKALAHAKAIIVKGGPVAMLAFGLVGCKGFLTAAPLVGADVGPVLTCVEAIVTSVNAPSTIEDAVAACVAAGVDIDQTVVAIEALVSAPDGGTSSVVADRIRRMPHRAVKR
jgi:hypothetical protein